MNIPERFDVFQDHPCEPQLIASFDQLEVAKAAMEKIASEIPGKYFVWSGEDQMVAQLNTAAARPQKQ